MVYARVSKTRGCNDLESSSLSPGTLILFDTLVRFVCALESHTKRAIIYF